MSAIQSLLRVMTLRDAEAIILETDKVPSLRRRGMVEKLAMPAIEATMLSDFTTPLLEGKSLGDGPATVAFRDSGGASYQVTIDQAAGGLRVVVKPGKPAAGVASTGASAPAPAATAATPWWAQSSKPAAPPSPAAIAAAQPHAARIEPSASAGPRSPEALARLGQLLAPLVAIAVERGASDVIMSTGQVRIRVGGRLESVEHEVADDELAQLVAHLGSNTDHSLELNGTRLRASLFDHLAGAAVAVRLIRDQVPALADLNLPPELAGVIEQRDGLILVCGPTGSGKSTTLASLVELINQRRAAHVITLEDPIEYRFTARRGGIVHQREVGTHIASFAAGLRAALREAPDVILLGELRDRDTISAALTAAETGHLVLATLHAPNAAGAIDRMIDGFPEAQQRQARGQLAAVLRTVVTQFLLPRRDGGQIPAIELVPITPAVSNLMRKGDLHMLGSAITTGRDAGMIPLERSLARILDSGAVAAQVVKSFAADHDLLASLAGKLR
jgi:twitching motility protein PilT